LLLAILVAAAAVMAPESAAAQLPDTIPSDTLPVDTLLVPIPPGGVVSDTLPADSLMGEVPDSTLEAPHLPEFADPWPEGWEYGAREWNRDELLRYRGLSLLDLLDHVPGLTSVRAGGFGRAAGLTVYGLGGSRVRVFLDGFEMDALAFPSHELQQIGLIDLERVRITREPGGIRIDLRTFRLPDARPYSEVEAAAGNFGTRILRATLSRVAGSDNVVTAAYDLATTGGQRINEPFEAVNGHIRWTRRLSDKAGFRVDLNHAALLRANADLPVNATRRDLLFRARAEPLPRLVIEGLIGRTWWNPDARTEDDETEEDPSPPGLPASGHPETAYNRASLRAGYDTDLGYIEASGRARHGLPDHSTLEASDISLRAASRSLLGITAQAKIRSSMAAGNRVVEYGATFRTTPVLGISVFGGLSGGERLLGARRDSVLIIAPDVFLTDTTYQSLPTLFVSHIGALRAGVSWSYGSATAGAAFVSLEPATVVPFGFAFDRAESPTSVGAANGMEAYASLPVPLSGGAVTLEGHYTDWREIGSRPYLPKRHARASLEYHRVAIEGQFEPTLRLDLLHRGESFVPAPSAEGFTAIAPSYNLFNLFLQIRVIDVRAFLFWENPLNNPTAVDLPDGLAVQPGQRIIYGARWFFRN
jgi:hypothetical protein